MQSDWSSWIMYVNVCLCIMVYDLQTQSVYLCPFPFFFLYCTVFGDLGDCAPSRYILGDCIPPQLLCFLHVWDSHLIILEEAHIWHNLCNLM